MFVLLEHRTGDASAPGASCAGVHWDFLVELAGQERLATWRLAQNPIAAAEGAAAERIADHRRSYLDYEGEISGGRGRVRRIDGGDCVIRRYANDELQVELHGQLLRGEYEITRATREHLVLRRAAPAG